MSKKVPAYLEIDAERVVVKLSTPSEANGIKVDKLVMRAPTVRDVRAAAATSNGDDEVRELQLFSSLTEVGVKDLEGFTMKDYTRLQAGYFRLVQDDEL
ncbi:Mu-like prophage FluMu protein gp41 [Pseudomonas asplenii]|uniref:Mu-like prophage FluMu protein gp41 n=1 Tax=Pseudomonas asplenii TaxID=53407 RepID=A0A0M9GBT7_9PSED|nr:phage tail assembly protein [Pseudomonas fuscovaginae]KPA87167.1 Mu-like prophage FluMu protein gp41 [Pseudomonas fuscovaginae]